MTKLKMKKGVGMLLAFLMVSLITSCSKDENSTTTDLKSYLTSNADYVHEINGFYIVGTAETPRADETTPGATGKEVFDHAVRLFSNFLDHNGDGKIDDDRIILNQQMAKTVMFVSGYLNKVDQISEASAVTGNGLYAMSMQTDNWPYVKGFTGKNFTVNQLNSSTWRPENSNALWEETFHTITEALSRSDSEFAFTEGKKLRQLMDADIAAGSYDISVQNQEENGNYDRVTAVNEYIHQIWMIHYAGQTDKLNTYQKQALDFMISKNVPMQLDPNYNHTIGSRVK